jgi:hypothetical protein
MIYLQTYRDLAKGKPKMNAEKSLSQYDYLKELQFISTQELDRL